VFVVLLVGLLGLVHPVRRDEDARGADVDTDLPPQLGRLYKSERSQYQQLYHTPLKSIEPLRDSSAEGGIYQMREYKGKSRKLTVRMSSNGLPSLDEVVLRQVLRYFPHIGLATMSNARACKPGHASTGEFLLHVGDDDGGARRMAAACQSCGGCEGGSDWSEHN